MEVFLVKNSNILNKKGQVIFKNNLTCKAPLVGSRSNRFWKDLKKLKYIYIDELSNSHRHIQQQYF